MPVCIRLVVPELLLGSWEPVKFFVGVGQGSQKLDVGHDTIFGAVRRAEEVVESSLYLPDGWYYPSLICLKVFWLLQQRDRCDSNTAVIS